MRSTRERIIHTLLFEALAIALVTPAFSWLTGAPLRSAGLLSLILSAWATVSNYGWTIVFDRLVPTRRRGLMLRAAQALGLELIISALGIPLIAWFTAVSLAEAVALDIGALAVFVVFSMIYNSVFDHVAVRLGAGTGVSS